MHPATLRDRVTSMMQQAWREPGYCVPNATVYPHQWLWDSCFHAVIWAHVNPARGLVEVENSLAKIGPTGFVPHMTYWSDPNVADDFWGRPDTSSITQPPMWGLAIDELEHVGVDVPLALKLKAARAVLHLCRSRPPTPAGLVPAYHPWETGCDDSPRWDSWATRNDSSNFDRSRWMFDKKRMLNSLVVDHHGAPVANRTFAVGSIGLNALIAWNATLLARSLGAAAIATELQFAAEQLVKAIRSRWQGEARTWVDEPQHGSIRPSCSTRTAESLLGLLVDPRSEAFAELVDEAAYGARFGPRGVHCLEPSFNADQYWRGPNWPQINYLLFRAACAADDRGLIDTSIAETLAQGLVRGACQSNLSEYWNAESGQGRGACPQTWTGLATCVLDGRQHLVEMGEADE